MRQELASGEGRREQKLPFGFGELEKLRARRQHPRQQRETHREQPGERHPAALKRRTEIEPALRTAASAAWTLAPGEDREVEVRDPRDAANQIARLSQPPQTDEHPVFRTAPRDVPARSEHYSRPVTLRKICSRFDPAAASALDASSATVPSATFRPRSMMTTRVQISSTR